MPESGSKTPTSTAAARVGRIDVHSHLLPGVDDGCRTLDESIACARRLAAAGYTHSFCTPHIWPNLPHNNPTNIAQATARLQAAIDAQGIQLKLIPGGELNLTPALREARPDQVVTYGLARKYVLFDLWADVLPAYFEPSVKWLQSLGLTVILAHPERMRAMQLDPLLAQTVGDMGVLLQGNLQCFSDPPAAATRRLVERFLLERRYFMLGSDLHNIETLQLRLEGLGRALEIGGADLIRELTVENPAQLLPE